jgi:hypothetical protein
MKLADTELSIDERRLVENCLLRGEEVLWAGKPVPHLWSGFSKYMFGFGLVFLLFSQVIFHYAAGDDVFFRSVFILVPLLLMVSPWVSLSWQRHHVYVLTNRRSIVFRYMFWKHHQMVFPAAKVMLLDRKVSAKGLVSLVLGKSTISSTNDVPDPEGFLNLSPAAAETVEPLIMQLESEQ